MQTRKTLILLLMFVLAIGCTTNCCAGMISITTNVLGTAKPWDNVSGNPVIGSGSHDGTAPTSIGVADGFDFAAGQSLTVTYVSGFVNFFNSVSPPSITADGVVGHEAETAGYPGFFMNPSVNQVFLMELVGGFTNSAGQLIGTPFIVGNGPTTLVIPSGTTYLKLGFNEVAFADNPGSVTVRVEQSTPPLNEAKPNPEPASVVLLGLGGGLIFVGRKLRRRKTELAA